MSNSMNDLANRIAILEAETDGEGLTAEIVLNAGGVNGILLAVVSWDNSASGAISRNVNDVISTGDVDIYYARQYLYDGSRTWEGYTRVPSGTYKCLSFFDDNNYSAYPLVLLTRLS